MLNSFDQWQGLALALAVASPLFGWLGWLWRPARQPAGQPESRED